MPKESIEKRLADLESKVAAQERLIDSLDNARTLQANSINLMFGQMVREASRFEHIDHMQQYIIGQWERVWAGIDEDRHTAHRRAALGIEKPDTPPLDNLLYMDLGVNKRE
jgi:uncharacterized coiled-coil protein SlyX